MSDEVIHIACAEDHLALRKSLLYLLNSLGGIAVDVEAANGKELIEKLGSAPALPSVCLLDISMPVMDGFETINELKKRWPQMHVLILTQHTLEHYIIRMIRAGAGGYLLKDSDPAEIRTAILAVHNNGIYHSELVPGKWSNAIMKGQIRLPDLTEMEKIVLKHCCSDLSYEEIGNLLKKSKRSIEGHRDNLFAKLNVNSRVSLALYAVKYGFVLLEHTSI